LATVISLTVVIAACGFTIGLDMSDRSAFERQEQQRAAAFHDSMQDLQRQYRMAELKLDDWTVVAHRAGLQLPGDYTRGPQGNMDPESFHTKGK
jgi:hypothetical protein